VIAALYVLTGGPYFNLEDVDPWDEGRDARLYAGPHPVVAHPPCERWGRYWFGGPSCGQRKELGDDAGCFEAALKAVNAFGGILEHPEGSHAWRMFNLATPPRSGGWVRAGLYQPGWTCCVEQGHYGHPARKATWLYAVGCELPELRWGSCGQRLRLEDGFHSADERARAIKTGVCQRLSQRQRKLTPEPFRDVLLSIARTSVEAGALDDDSDPLWERDAFGERIEF
jgi:hypothetical protein